MLLQLSAPAPVTTAVPQWSYQATRTVLCISFHGCLLVGVRRPHVIASGVWTIVCVTGCRLKLDLILAIGHFLYE